VRIPHNHRQTKQRNKERQVRAGQSQDGDAALDDGSLNGWEERTAQDGHDESGTRYLDVLANALQGQAVDGREHQRQADADRYQTIDAVTVCKENDSYQCCYAYDAHGGKHACG